MVLYMVKVDTENLVAHAIDQIGAVIASVRFDSLDDLCSNSFEQYMRDAVATVLQMNKDEYEPESKGGDEEFESAWKEHQLEEESIRLAKMMDDEEKAALEMKKRQEADDLAVAMELQAREAGGLKPAKKVGWASGLEGLKGGLQPRQPGGGDALEGFPALPKMNKSLQHTPTFQSNSSIEGPKKQESYAMSRDDEDADVQLVMRDWRVHCGDVDGVLGSRINDADRNFILEAAAMGQQQDNGGKNGISPNSFKKMMKATDKTPQSTLDGSVEDREGEIDRDRYSRKNIRKLVLDMVSAGWRPLAGRGGGHYMYERVVELDDTTKYKQLLVLACTPSDIRNIDIVYARLLKCDREAEELKRSHKRERSR